jgi:hypothetical protein
MVEAQGGAHGAAIGGQVLPRGYLSTLVTGRERRAPACFSYALRTTFEGSNRALLEHFEPRERLPARGLATRYAPPTQIVYRRRTP